MAGHLRFWNVHRPGKGKKKEGNTLSSWIFYVETMGNRQQQVIKPKALAV